jgi:rhamnosyltransferase
VIASTHRKRVCSITVAFEPSPARLLEQLRAVRPQVDEIVLVDNGSDPPLEQMAEVRQLGARVLTPAENRGIAAGFNMGIRHARETGCDRVLLLDDDSVPAPEMVATLADVLDGHANERVAAVGPRIRDPRDPQDYPFIRLGWTHNRHLRCGTRDDPAIACDFLVSSGSLIPIEALARLGEFDEALFIDSVDLEWCFRARAQGFALYGVCATYLDHRLGDRRKTVLNAELVVHPPERIYYMTRNRFLLYRRGYMPLKWKVKDVLRVMGKFAVTMLLIAPRLEYARMTGRAIVDAAAKRGGKLHRDSAA